MQTPETHKAVHSCSGSWTCSLEPSFETGLDPPEPIARGRETEREVHMFSLPSSNALTTLHTLFCLSKTCQILGKSHSGNVILAFCMCLQNNPCSALRSTMAWPCGSSWPQMGVFLPKPLHSLFQYINVCWKPDSSLFVYISDYIF